jgi:predicted negative regulator of RcsB-dependent stress response
MKAPRLLAAALLTAIASHAAAADSHVSDYWEIVRLYARGERARALAQIGPWSDANVERQLADVRDELAAIQRCPSCPRAGRLPPLRAAVMLHADSDELKRRVPSAAATGDLTFTEERLACPGRDAWIASQYAGFLAQWPEGRDFARRFFLSIALRSQQAGCLQEALRWLHDGLRRFPHDADLAFALGSVLEQDATARPIMRAELAAGQRTRAFASAEARKQRFREARGSFTEALSADPGSARTRLHLGRVLWRMGEPGPALEQLEQALTGAQDPALRYLVQLFIGRVHEDAERIDVALAHYRQALDLDPTAQSATIALSHALQVAGDKAGARQTLAAAGAGSPSARDPYWAYLWGDVPRVETLCNRLRAESLE